MISHAMARAIVDAQNPDGRPYAWTITRDRTFELNRITYPDRNEASSVGIKGPRNPTGDAAAALARGEGIPFRLYDEGDLDQCAETETSPGVWVSVPGAVLPGHPDYGLMYEGRIYVTPGADDEWLFAPAEDFGTPMNGYADVRYLAADGVTWKSL